MTYNIQELEELLRNNRIENSFHKEALRQQLFGGARHKASAESGAVSGISDAELSGYELEMAAGGLSTKPFRDVSDKA